jgi:hypothetical protein
LISRITLLFISSTFLIGSVWVFAADNPNIIKGCIYVLYGVAGIIISLCYESFLNRYRVIFITVFAILTISILAFIFMGKYTDNLISVLPIVSYLIAYFNLFIEKRSPR